MNHRIVVPVILAVTMMSTTAHAQADSPGDVNNQWLATACNPTPVDTTSWPRHRIGDVTIAFPPEYRVDRRTPYGRNYAGFVEASTSTLLLRSTRSSIRLTMHGSAAYTFDGLNRARPKQAWCDGSYGGYPNEVVAWIDGYRFNFLTRWEATWGGDDAGKVLVASFGSDDPKEAFRLRAALNTMLPAKDDPGNRNGGNPNGWFWNPCLPDSVDTWGWTRYDLHGVRIRLPREAKQVKVPNIDELHFRAGQGSMRLQLARDASRLFAEYNVPERVHRRCDDDIGGLMAEAISFRLGTHYGFAARWADADRGEWLTAIIEARTLAEVAFLRRMLFTIVFPEERRR